MDELPVGSQSLYDYIDEFRRRKLIAERLANRQAALDAEEPVKFSTTVSTPFGGITVANPYAGINRAATAIRGGFLDKRIDEQIAAGETAKRQALKQLLGDIDTQDEYGNRRALTTSQALALSDLGVNPGLVRELTEQARGAAAKNYLVSNAGAMGNPAAIESMYLGGGFGPVGSPEALEKRDTLIQRAEGYLRTRLIDAPTTVAENRALIKPTPESLASRDAGMWPSAGGSGGTASRGVSGVREWQKGGKYTPGEIVFVAPTEFTTASSDPDAAVIAELNKDARPTFYKINDQRGMVPVSESDPVVQAALSGNAAGQQPSGKGYVERARDYGGIPEGMRERISKAKEKLTGSEVAVEGMYKVQDLFDERGDQLFGDRARSSELLGNVAAEVGGPMGAVLSAWSKAMQNPSQVEANQALLMQALENMRSLGGNDTERELRTITANMPSSYSDPAAARAWIQGAVSKLSTAIEADRARLIDQTTFLPNSNLLVSDTPEAMNKNYGEIGARRAAEVIAERRRKRSAVKDSAAEDAELAKQYDSLRALGLAP